MLSSKMDKFMEHLEEYAMMEYTFLEIEQMDIRKENKLNITKMEILNQNLIIKMVNKQENKFNITKMEILNQQVN